MCTRSSRWAGAHDVEWLGARDAALLTLLYGAGLRISEALSLKRGDVPLGETLTVLGKGRKERSVPVLPLVAVALNEYSAKLPFTGAPSSPSLNQKKRTKGVHSENLVSAPPPKSTS